MLRTDETHVAAQRSANYLATYRNGPGYDTVRLRDRQPLGNGIAGEDVDGNRHVWTSGADVHITEVSR